MPICSGSPMCTGAPCTPGKREVICTARIASAGLNERIDTTRGPWNGPAGAVGTEVRNIGTFLPAYVVVEERWTPDLKPGASLW